MTFSTSTSSISYDLTHGNGTPILFLHGALGTGEQMKPLQALFAGRTQISLDLPSHGKSTTSRDQVTVQSIATEMLQLLNELKIEQADIIGYSLGGYVGIEMARQRRSAVRSIVSHAMKFYWTDTAITTSVADLDVKAIRAKSEKAYNALSHMHEANGLHRTMELSRSLINNFSTSQLAAQDIAALQIPLLLSVGDRDELVSLQEIVRLYGELDRSLTALTIHPNTRHPLHFLPKDTFKVAVEQFWNTHKLSPNLSSTL